jgi:type IV secretory pathway VirJ component
MKRVLVLIVLISVVTVHAGNLMVDSVQFGRFGKVVYYRTTEFPSRVVLFVSGDGGWNKGVVDMARSLAGDDALVLGIDIVKYLKQLDLSKERCSYPAADFEMLSQYIQKKLDFPTYHTPILVGYSSGATLVYALLAQAPPNTFAGAISMGFCPDLPVTKPFCKGNGLEFEPGPKGKGYNFLPVSNLSQPWIAFQGQIDQVCDPKSVEQFVKKVNTGEIVPLPKVGHGFSVQRNWLPQLHEAFAKLSREDTATSTAPSPAELSGLPLVELPATGGNRDLLAVILSGDGGWASIDKRLGEYFSAHGIAVVGLNSLKYFWSRKTPDTASIDLNRIIDYYTTDWRKSKVLLVGYSRGADVLPFMANRLPQATLDKIAGVALLGLESRVDFKFHLTDWLGGGDPKSALPVKPEVQKLKGLNVICFYGDDEKNSACRTLDTSWVKVVEMQGGHHFGGDYETIAKTILEKLPK